MKRFFALLLTATLLLASASQAAPAQNNQETETQSTNTAPALSATAEEQVIDHLTVGNPNPLNGNFFTDLWGNVTSDQDVRALLHGYNLIRWDGEEGMFTYDPSVVRGLTVTEDAEGNRTYTFILYEDLYYSDGTQITAWDYAFSVLLQIAPEMAELGAYPAQKPQLMGFQDYVSGDAAFLTGVRVLGDFIVSFIVNNEYLPFFYELAYVQCTPYPAAVIAPGVEVRDNGMGIYLANEDDTVTEPVFTAQLLQETILDEETGYRTHPGVVSGPYMLTKWDGETAEFEMNPYYKGNYKGDTPTVQTLTFSYADNATMIEDLKEGKFDLLNKVTNSEVISEGIALTAATAAAMTTDEDADADAAEDADADTDQDADAGADKTKAAGADTAAAAVLEDGRVVRMSNYARNGMGYVAFMCEKPALSDETVRKAMAWCMDREQIMEDYTGYYGLRVDGYYGIGQWLYRVVNGTIEPPIEAPEDETDAQAMQEYEEQVKAFEELSLEDQLTAYEVDLTEAEKLLDEAGWVKNQDGIREKQFRVLEDGTYVDADDASAQDGKLETVKLELTLIYPEDNHTIAESLEKNFVKNLEKAGISLTLEATPMGELLNQFYGYTERTADMIFLASNFDTVFDPSTYFDEVVDEETGEITHVWRNAGLADEELYESTQAMHETEPGDVLTYCQHWMDFQTRFNDVLPMLPIYSNVYFDFYCSTLQDYEIGENTSWADAIVGSYMSDEEPEEETGTAEEGAEDDDGLVACVRYDDFAITW